MILSQGTSGGPSTTMIDVYSPRNEAELILLRSILDDAGVHYFVKNDLFGSLTVGPQIELYNRKTVCVADSDAEETRQIIREFLARIDGPASAPLAADYSLGDKLRMIAEVLLFGWMIPGRRHQRKGPQLRLIKGAGVEPERGRDEKSSD